MTSNSGKLTRPLPSANDAERTVLRTGIHDVDYTYLRPWFYYWYNPRFRSVVSLIIVALAFRVNKSFCC